YSSDIENQLYLFQPKHNSTIIAGTKNLEGFFAKLNGKTKKLKRGTKEYAEAVRANSEQIRDKVLRTVMIRRTRTEIVANYGDDLNKQGLSFPKLGTPEKIIYSFDAETDEVFKETMNIIKSLDYARYTPLLFLKDNKKFSTMLISQKNMSGFMKSILVKRLESSFHAFKMTLDRFIVSYERFIEMINAGEVYISKKVDVYDLLDNGDDEKLLDMVEQERVQKFNADEFTEDFLPSLNRDLALLKRLKSHWSHITVDPKLAEFIKELKSNQLLQNRKMIIFTESKETAEYLGKAVKELKSDRVAVFSGASSQYLKRDIENSFNPKMKDKDNDKYDILITTDILAEGINLHRAGILFNYDLPWNPTKIMQRVGRINRVGTEFDRIYVFNFFPTSQTSAQLPLKERIIEKLQAFHDTLGEDFKYLSEDEEVSSHKLYNILTDNLDAEEEGTNPELAYLREIRDV
ncbi:MAG: C-terminal helicase domain-containing protein, partial [Bacteroidaceae bacterium]